MNEVGGAGGLSIVVDEVGGVLVVLLDGGVLFGGDDFSEVEVFPSLDFVKG